MTPEEYEAKVAASPAVGGYASSSQRWRDHLEVYPDVDGSTIRNVRELEQKAIEEEKYMAEIEARLSS